MLRLQFRGIRNNQIEKKEKGKKTEKKLESKQKEVHNKNKRQRK